MKVVIIGIGYVDLVTGTCFTEMGIDVMCADNDDKKVDSFENGIISIYDPSLEDLIHKNAEAGRL